MSFPSCICTPEGARGFSVRVGTLFIADLLTRLIAKRSLTCCIYQTNLLNLPPESVVTRSLEPHECRLSCSSPPRFSRLNIRMFAVNSPSLRRFVLTACATLFLVHTLAAQGTHLWTQSRIEEFEKGTPQGVAIGSNGYLREGPGLTELLTTPSTFVWSVAVDKSGTPYLGTGSPATVLRASTQKDSKPFTLFESRDVSVQVVRIGPDGSLYAATVPGGKVYKLNPSATAKQDESSAKVIFDAAKPDGGATESKATRESKSHYIWDMTFDAAGKLYIAVGGPGAIYRVDPANSDARPELFFKSDEQHIRSLAWDAKGNLIAGSDGSGLVYRISPQGKGYVLFEAPRREITSVAVAANGTIFAASVGDKSHNPLPPLRRAGRWIGYLHHRPARLAAGCQRKHLHA